MSDDEDTIEVHKDVLFDQSVIIQGEMVRIKKTIQPIVIIDEAEATVPGTGHQVKAALKEGGGVTEENSLLISEYIDRLRRVALSGETFDNLASASASVLALANHVKMFVTGVATGGGALLAIDLVPAVVGSKACMNLTHFWSDQTDVSINMVISAPGGLLYGVGGLNIATVTNQVTPDYSPGLAYKTVDDGEALVVEVAAGQMGAGQILVFMGQLWYEP